MRRVASWRVVSKLKEIEERMGYMSKTVEFTLEPPLNHAIRVARKRQGLSLAMAAEKVPCDARTLHRWERQETHAITLDTVVRLAQVLKAPHLVGIAVQQIQSAFPQEVA